MLRIGQAVAIELSLEAFAADRDFAPLREGRARGGDSLADVRKRLLAGVASGSKPAKRAGAADGRTPRVFSPLASSRQHWRITYIYGDGRCDLALREAAGERTLRNFPLRYLRALPALAQAPSPEDAPASADVETPAAEPVSLQDFIRQHGK